MDEEVYYVERNADPRDHRVNVLRPAPARAVVMPSRTYAAAPPASTAFPTTTYPGQFFGQTPMYGTPVYGQPPYLGGTLGSLFGGVNLGMLVDIIGQGFAALRALPTAPTSTGDVATDVANLTLFQDALAKHGKSDEQIRTAVHVVAKLLGG